MTSNQKEEKILKFSKRRTCIPDVKLDNAVDLGKLTPKKKLIGVS